MRYLSYMAALVAALFAGASGAVDLPQVGSIVQGDVKVGHYTVPLPQGSWTVLSAKEDKTSRTPDVKDAMMGHINVLKVVLAQAQNNVLAGIIQVEATASFEGESFKASPAVTMQDAFYAENFYVQGSARGKPSIVYVNPYHFSSSDFGGVVKDFVEKDHLTVSKSVFVNVFYRLAKYGGYMNVSFMFNPAVEGATLSRVHAKTGAWHPSQHNGWVEDEKAIVQKYEQWAKEWTPKMIAGFEH